MKKIAKKLKTLATKIETAGRRNVLTDYEVFVIFMKKMLDNLKNERMEITGSRFHNIAIEVRDLKGKERKEALKLMRDARKQIIARWPEMAWQKTFSFWTPDI